MKKPKFILVTGIMHSGTSIVASMIGAHSEVNMLCEEPTNAITRLYGKKYAGNKLCWFTQIRPKMRANKLIYLLRRIVGNILPISQLSLQDYIDMGAKIILVTRDYDDVVRSLVKRDKFSQWRIDKILKKGMIGVMCHIHKFYIIQT